MDTFYSSTDICKIIKECSKSGVSSISLPNIKILFGKKPEADQPEQVFHHLSVEDQPLEGKTVDVEGEVRAILAQQERETLHLADPQEWERSELMEMDLDEATR